MYKLSKRSISNMEGVDSKLIAMVEGSILITPIDFGIPTDGGLRTAKRQNELYTLEVSGCDGYDKMSRHQTGEAVDFFAYVDGKASYDYFHMSVVAATMLQWCSQNDVSVEWGGLWTSVLTYPLGSDMPHIQLRK